MGKGGGYGFRGAGNRTADGTIEGLDMKLDMGKGMGLGMGLRLIMGQRLGMGH